MVDGQLIGAIIFFIFLTIFVYRRRKDIEFQRILFPLLYFAMLRTQLGVGLMDRMAKRWPRFWDWFGVIGVVVGFIGMIGIAFLLIENLWRIIFIPEAVPGVGLVLPFKVKGGFYVPFFYWIISIFIIAVVHEFAHGVMARAHNMKVKSSGFAFLGVIIPIIPAAFVEPDEKEIVKRSHKQQLSVYAAGAFTNILLAIVILGLTALLIAPAVNSVAEFNGVKLTDVIKDKPADVSGMEIGDRIISADGNPTPTVLNLTEVLDSKRPGDKILFTTEESNYTITLGANPENDSKAYLGVSLTQSSDLKPGVVQKYGTFLPSSILWIAGLFYWLYVLNLGVGLFNLAPLGPIDGGRMLKVATEKIFRNKARGDKAWKYVSMFFLGLVLVNLLFGFFK